ncbi:MAG TPA: hypothetical protein VMB52_02530 [Verrucomicrobiae bacterium]|nr:hypothetical protein [Verrucomicrobiae bacterium]
MAEKVPGVAGERDVPTLSSKHAIVLGHLTEVDERLTPDYIQARLQELTEGGTLPGPDPELQQGEQ